MKSWFTQGSWKTTSAGLLAIAGGIVRLAFAIKSGNVSEEAVMTTITTIVTGIGLLVARDNNVTSEQVNAGKHEPTVTKSTLPLLLIGAMCISPLAVTSCKTTPPAVITYRALADTQIIVDRAMRTYGRLCAEGKVSVSKQAQIDAAHAQYRIAFRIAITGLTTKDLTPDTVHILANDLLKLISLL